MITDTLADTHMSRYSAPERQLAIGSRGHYLVGSSEPELS